MKLSARNQIKGKIIEVKKGATTAHVRVEIATGQVITSSITNEAVEDIGLKVGDAAIVVIKASDVMIGLYFVGTVDGCPGVSAGAYWMRQVQMAS